MTLIHPAVSLCLMLLARNGFLCIGLGRYCKANDNGYGRTPCCALCGYGNRYCGRDIVQQIKNSPPTNNHFDLDFHYLIFFRFIPKHFIFIDVITGVTVIATIIFNLIVQLYSIAVFLWEIC